MASKPIHAGFQAGASGISFFLEKMPTIQANEFIDNSKYQRSLLKANSTSGELGSKHFACHFKINKKGELSSIIKRIDSKIMSIYNLNDQT